MAFAGKHSLLIPCAALLAIFIAGANGIDIFLEWDVAADTTIKPLSVDQPVCSTSHNFLFQILLVSGSSLKVTVWCLFLQVITINGMFPGPLINSTTNDFVHVNVFNNLDEPLLFTWYAHRIIWSAFLSSSKCSLGYLSRWKTVLSCAGMAYSKG